MPNTVKLGSIVFFAFALMFYAAAGNASPIPGFGNSKLVAPQIGLFRSAMGFEINSGSSGWAHTEPPENNKLISTMYEAKDGASLTVRVDHLENKIPVEKYVQRWTHEYPRYGFDVLGANAFVQNKQKGYYFDLINRDTGKQIRQVVFMKEQTAVILTCRDKISEFAASLKGCDQIVRTFSWNQ